MQTILNTLGILISLRNVVNVNEILHAIRCLPVIGKHISEKIYGIRVIKILAMFFSIGYEILKMFFGKFCLFAFLFLASGGISSLNDYSMPTIYLYGMIIFLIAGVFIYSPFRADAVSRYAVLLMGMDARRYTITKFVYDSIGVAVGYTLFGIPSALLAQVPWYIALLQPLAGLGIRAFSLGIEMTVFSSYARHNKTKKSNLMDILLLFMIVMTAFIAGPWIVMDSLLIVPAIAIILLALMFVAGVLLVRRFPHSLYRNAISAEQARSEIIKSKTKNSSSRAKELEVDNSARGRSDASGYKFMHELFIKRHSGVFVRKMVASCLITAICIALASMLLKLEISEYDNIKAESIVRLLVAEHPGAFILALLAVNSAPHMTRVMYANCDTVFLTYPFYRTPSAIMKMFWLRLRSIILFNLPPAVMTSIFCVAALWLTGGEDLPLQSLLTVIAVMTAPVFFSAFYLAIYYLIQPYSSDFMIKSKLTMFLTSVVGFCCLVVAGLNINALVLTSMCVIATSALVWGTSKLVHRFGSKTLKIR